MVLPLFIAGTLGAGTATAYNVYQAGRRFALPSSKNEIPANTARSFPAGVITAVAAYSIQSRLLKRYVLRFITYEVPKNVTKWAFRHFFKIATPIVAPRLAILSTSVGLMSYVRTKINLRGNKHHSQK